jgi:predicted  nucleic acid-binding Zn-ribbon protein
MSQISILYRLQQIDSQLDNAQISLQNVEKELSDNSLIQDAQLNVIDAEQKYQVAVKRQRDSENKSYDVRVKIELSEASLYGGKIHNPKELQDIQNEVASLKRLIITLEDLELESMLAVEEADSNLNHAKEAANEIQARHIEHSAILNGEKTRLLSQIERLEAERNAAIPPISATELALYEQLRKARNGVAVVKISSKACGACGATLTAAVIQTTQSPGQLVRCPTCGRILYPG